MANTLLAGAGYAGAHQQLVNLAGAVRAPVVHAFRGKEFVDWHPPRRYRWDSASTRKWAEVEVRGSPARPAASVPAQSPHALRRCS
jgi:hypothetical protein